MKNLMIASACLGGLALAGCTSTGALTPSAQTTVTNAYNQICPSVTALGALQMNARQAKAYASAVSICANGAPTNVIVAGLDIIAVQAVLGPMLPKIKF